MKPGAHKLTLVNRFAFPDDSPTSRLMHDLITTLKLRRPDIDIRVLCCNRLYNGSTERLPAREEIAGVRFTRLWVPSAKRSGLLMRALGYLAFYMQGFLSLLTSLRRSEWVICMSDPPMFNVLATLACQTRGANTVHWVQDLYPDVVQSAGLINSPTVMSLLRKLRNSAYRASACLIVIGEGMRDRLLRDNTGCPIEVIPNWANGSSIQPTPKQQLALSQEWLPHAQFVIGYFGNMGFAHNFQSSLQAAALLRNLPEVQFLWVGDGKRRLEFQQSLHELDIHNVHWKGQQPFERMSEILGLADIHLVMLDPRFDEVLVPSKVYSALAAGRTLLFLGNTKNELARLIREHDIGVVVELDDSVGIANAIRRLAAHPDQCRDMGARARLLFDQRFDRTQVMNRWLRLMQQWLPCATTSRHQGM